MDFAEKAAAVEGADGDKKGAWLCIIMAFKAIAVAIEGFFGRVHRVPPLM